MVKLSQPPPVAQAILRRLAHATSNKRTLDTSHSARQMYTTSRSYHGVQAEPHTLPVGHPRANAALWSHEWKDNAPKTKSMTTSAWPGQAALLFLLLALVSPHWIIRPCSASLPHVKDGADTSQDIVSMLLQTAYADHPSTSSFDLHRALSKLCFRPRSLDTSWTAVQEGDSRAVPAVVDEIANNPSHMLYAF